MWALLRLKTHLPNNYNCVTIKINNINSIIATKDQKQPDKTKYIERM